MNRPDDDFPDLHDELLAAIGAEPPMSSQPQDDVLRGRKMARRRRWAAVGTAAAVVPAMTLGAYAVSTSLGDPAGSGANTVELQPAGAPQTGAEDPSGTLTAECDASPMPSSGSSGRMTPIGPRSGSSGKSGDSAKTSVIAQRSDGGNDQSARVATVAPRMDRQARALPPAGAGSQDGGVPGSEMGSVEPAPGDCIAVSGDDIYTAEIDRVTAALNRHIDPDGTHAGMAIAGGSVGDGDTNSGIYVGQEWTDGDSTGTVSLSVEDPTVGNGGSCVDPSLVGGPEVTCETRTLDDGTTVLVGRGEQGGAERITVQYVRPDGSFVWATADEATEQWWDDGSGAAPLTSSPATIDQLIELARDVDVHL